MKNIPDELKEHLAQAATTICSCWIVERKDGQTIGFTDHDHDLTVDGVHCESVNGFEATEAASQLGLAVDNQEVMSALSSENISEEDVLKGVYDDARVNIWTVNWQSPEQAFLSRVANIGEVSRADGVFRAELRSITAALDKRVGRSFRASCDAALGDGRCTVDLSDPRYLAEGSVDVVVSGTTYRSGAIVTFETGWFVDGLLHWQTGANAGTSSVVVAGNHERADEISVLAPPAFPVAEGDEFHVVAGCDKLFATCKTKFGNDLNFRGFPHMPGQDFILSYPQNGIVHDGRPLVD